MLSATSNGGFIQPHISTYKARVLKPITLCNLNRIEPAKPTIMAGAFRRRRFGAFFRRTNYRWYKTIAEIDIGMARAKTRGLPDEDCLIAIQLLHRNSERPAIASADISTVPRFSGRHRRRLDLCSRTAGKHDKIRRSHESVSIETSS